MQRRTLVGVTLVVVGVALLGATAAVPVEKHLVHDTRGHVVDNETTIERHGYQIVAYENLSDRGQELYRLTLTNDGRYRVPPGVGASDFEYPTRSETRGSDPSSIPGRMVIERPANASLPPADEGDDIGTRYDSMATFRKRPPLTSPANVPHLLGLVFGVTSLAAGGYLLFSK